MYYNSILCKATSFWGGFFVAGGSVAILSKKNARV
jgi:DNA-binding transcriptional regulator WhiA